MRRWTKRAPETRASIGIRGMLAPEILKIGWSENAFLAFRRQYDLKTGSPANLKICISLKPLNLKTYFFGAETAYSFKECHYFKRTKIEIKLKIRIVHWVCCSKS